MTIAPPPPLTMIITLTMTKKELKNCNVFITASMEEKFAGVSAAATEVEEGEGEGGRLHKFINCRRRRSFHALSTSQHFKYAKLITFMNIFSFLHNGEDFWVVGFYTGLDWLDKG